MLARTKVILLLLCISLFGIGVAVERFTLPETSQTMHSQAAEHLSEQTLPTPPNAFLYDGCTLFPDDLLFVSLSEACLAHDIAYWAGGDIANRKVADIALRDTISHTNATGKILAPVMYVGVRAFGNTFLTKLFNANWGYGWNS